MNAVTAEEKQALLQSRDDEAQRLIDLANARSIIDAAPGAIRTAGLNHEQFKVLLRALEDEANELFASRGIDAMDGVAEKLADARAGVEESFARPWGDTRPAQL